MKNKRVVISIVSIVILLVILCIGIFLINKSDENGINVTGAFNEINDTGAFNDGYFTTENYSVSISSKEVGHPNYLFNFETSYYSETYIRSNYEFKYDIRIGVNAKEDSVYNAFENYDLMEDISIFNKTFKYKEISNKEIILIYKYDNNFYITITLIDISVCYNLEGNYILDENGNNLMLEEYDFLEFAKEDENFRKTLTIEINKK